MHRARSTAALAIAGAHSAWGSAALAGAPMVTEDANVLNPRECEWESTANRTTAGGFSLRTLSTKVGCGLVPSMQLALGAEYAISDSVSALADTYGSKGSKPLMGVGLRWQASTDWTLGLMASQSRDTPKARDVLLSAKMAF